MDQPPTEADPDEICDYTTSSDQAALYRLNGDLNPLHIDPTFAAIAGFDRLVEILFRIGDKERNVKKLSYIVLTLFFRPILHGLGTLGIAIRQIHSVVQNRYQGRQCIKAFKCRFAKPVYPGQTIR